MGKLIQEAEINDAFIREVKTGFQLERAREEDRHRDAREEAHEYRMHNRTVKGLGKVISVMPARDWFRCVAKYGLDEVQSKQFQRGLRKHERDLTVNQV